MTELNVTAQGLRGGSLITVNGRASYLRAEQLRVNCIEMWLGNSRAGRANGVALLEGPAGRRGG
jgi:hypothetical protein